MNTAGSGKPVRIAKDTFASFGQALLQDAGASPGDAQAVIEHLLEAETMGLRSHGVIRLPQYLADIAAGSIDPRGVPQITPTASGRALVDGRRGFGQVVGLAMAREAVRLAKLTGVSFVVGRRMGHTGRVGAYAAAIANRGLVGIVVCGGPRSGHFVAPFGGMDGRLATNPIAFAYPSQGEPPVVADFSTSVVPEGVIRTLRNRGLAAPEGALRDAQGAATTDPAALYGVPPGTIQPLGGAFGYRGTALGLLVEVLAGLFAGDDAEDPDRAGSNLGMLAIDCDPAFPHRASRMGRYVRSARPIDPYHPVIMPGERELQAAQQAGAEPITVDEPTWEALARAAEGRRVLPKPLVDGPS